MFRNKLKKLHKFNISPFKPDIISSIFILIWGLNVVIYLGEQVANYCDVASSESKITKVKKQPHYDFDINEVNKPYFSSEYYTSINNTLPFINLTHRTFSGRAPPAA
jgi:hypothetical protein